MMKRTLLAGLLMATGCAAAPAFAEGQDAGPVLQRIVLMRHGIRSPTKAPEALATYADQPWPTWPVAPGQLTPHGIATLRSLGKRMAMDLADAGLPHDACTQPLLVIADTTPRNRASASALLEGLSPDCAPAYRAFPAGQEDPLFHGTKGRDDDDDGIDAAMIDAPVRETLAELEKVLGKPSLPAGDVAKALKTAGSLSENIMLAYVQGMPASQYGWGRLDEAGVARIIGLHNASFQLAHATPEASRGRGGNMLAHIAATLGWRGSQKASRAGRAPTGGELAGVTPLGDAGTRVIVLIGHDTDLATEAGLLGLHWHDATQADDYPPGGALVYDLVQTTSGAAVRVSIAMPTLAALRSGDMGPDPAIVRKVLTQPACGGVTLCPIDRFTTIAARAVGPAGNEPPAT